MSIGLLLTSFAFGLRHGVDWDHIAAIADLSSSGESRRHGFVLSALYAIGHAIVVLILGIGAIAVGAAIPEGVDEWMGRVVGVTLVGLGAWILIEIVRRKSDFRLQSRWILILNGTFAGLRRVRQTVQGRKVAIDHEHNHDHDHDVVSTQHEAPHAHDHAHAEADIDLTVAQESRELVGAEPSRGGIRSLLSRGRHAHHHAHSHAHQHELHLADDPKTAVGNGTAAGIGMLHGIGIESPTQIAVFVASTAAVGWASGVALLLAWCVGLVVANAGLALLAGFGMLHAERNFAVYVTVAVLVAVASIAMGLLLLTGVDALPEINL